MATVTHQWPAAVGAVQSTSFPQLVRANGTSIPITGYAFDASSVEAIFLDLRAVNYGSGNLTVSYDWYADTATSGNVVWGVQLAAITPDTDTQDTETKALATASTVTDSHLGTTGQRLHRAIITASNLDSLAADDDLRLRVYRDASNGSDTMTGDAVLVRVTVSYSDV